MTPTQSRLVSKVVEQTQSEFIPVSFSNMHEFSKSYFIMILIAVIALIFEVFKRKLINWKNYLISLIYEDDEWDFDQKKCLK